MEDDVEEDLKRMRPVLSDLKRLALNMAEELSNQTDTIDKLDTQAEKAWWDIRSKQAQAEKLGHDY